MENAGKIVGILVFLGGMVLMGYVLSEAWQLPDEFQRGLQDLGQDNPGQVAEQPAYPQDIEDAEEAGGSGGLSPTMTFLASHGYRLLHLLILAGIAALISHKGAVLIGAFRKREE